MSFVKGFKIGEPRDDGPVLDPETGAIHPGPHPDEPEKDFELDPETGGVYEILPDGTRRLALGPNQA